MDAAQLLVTILGAGGGGAAILALVNGLIKWLSGAASRERDKNTDLVAQRRKAVQERENAERDRDEADKRRRFTEEYASSLRRQLIEAGLEPVDLPEDESAFVTQEKLVLNREQPPSLPTVPIIPTHPKTPYS